MLGQYQDLQKKNPLFAEMLRTLIEGGRIYLWDPKGGAGSPELVTRLKVAEHLKLVRLGDLMLAAEKVTVEPGTRVTTPEEFAKIDWKAWDATAAGFSFDAEQLFLERPRTNAGLFLDRDGVVVELVDHLSDPKQVRIKDGIVPLLKRARELKYKIVIITNQSGLGRGRFEWKDFDAVQTELSRQLVAQGVWVDDVENAPHFADSAYLWGKLFPHKRKPGAAMLKRLCQRHGIDPKRSTLVGDRKGDLEAGHALGIPNLFLIESFQTDDDKKELAYPYRRVKAFDPEAMLRENS